MLGDVLAFVQENPLLAISALGAAWFVLEVGEDVLEDARDRVSLERVRRSPTARWLVMVGASFLGGYLGALSGFGIAELIDLLGLGGIL